MGKLYKGWRLVPKEGSVSDVVVQIINEGHRYDMDPEISQKIYNHSPTGFSWGYNGSGPAQLALAILYDHTQNQSKAIQFYQRFKTFIVAGWGDDWEITSEEIQRLIDKWSEDDL